ncbi:hypothetical protein [Senimuribacter intestinalis]|uniref:hypothetical protein n=1 Tax=Senimuribacter intestinalis TaxID=2941507 RepID=UPI00203EDC74|nr:hypothetical protein [Senimuribacter intestinalis]
MATLEKAGVIVGKDKDGNIVIVEPVTAVENVEGLPEELAKYLPKSGGTLTGNLTGKYLTGTWLQTTAVSRLGSKPDKIAVIDSAGWIYYRTLDDLLTDLGVAGKPIYLASTLSASGWSNGQYSFEGSYPKATYDLSVEPDSTCTEAQLDAWSGARIVGSSAGNVLKAFGDVPTVDIPVILEVKKK